MFNDLLRERLREREVRFERSFWVGELELEWLFGWEELDMGLGLLFGGWCGVVEERGEGEWRGGGREERGYGVGKGEVR